MSAREPLQQGRGGAGGGTGGAGGDRPLGGAVREREAGVMYKDNYSYLSEMADFVDQLKM